MKIVTLTAALLALMLADARAQDAALHGHTLAKDFCASCHAIGPWGRSKHRDAPPFRILGRTIDLDGIAQQLSRGLSSTHPDMPEFKFSIDDARDLRAYLRAIQR